MQHSELVNTAEDAEDRTRGQTDDETSSDSRRLEYCKRFRELKADWLEFISNNPVRTSQFKVMSCFQVELSIISAIEKGDIRASSGIKPLDLCKTAYEYQRSLRTLIKLDEVYCATRLRRDDKSDIKLTFTYDLDGSLQWYGIFAPEFYGRRPSSHVVLQNKSNTWMEVLAIEESLDDHLILDWDRLDFYAEYFRDEIMNAYFVSSPYSFFILYKAVDKFSDSCRIQMIAIEDMHAASRYSNDKIALGRTNTTQLQSRLNNLDPSQRQAVRGILRARCWPRAYIIYGSPGSGKSHTIVEAVIQIFKRSELSVLVCAGPNSCADDLYERLITHLPAQSVLRLRAGMRARPHRIVVTTNMKSNSLVGLSCFDYVIIDEANYSSALETLVPISLLKEDGCLVLVGDLSLLLPNSDSTDLLEMNYNDSLLDRIIDFKVYEVKNEESGQRDSDYITVLAHCHRVDERIISTLNKLFYDEQVECSEHTPRSLLNILQLTGPLQFLKIFGQEDQPILTRSIANEDEANACVDIIIRLYKIGLEPEQIGVMSPFRFQSQKIRSKLSAALETNATFLNRRFPKRHNLLKGERPIHVDEPNAHDWLCKTGTIESYQGVEREVIIMSTVSSTQFIEYWASELFIKDANHFNFAISRAKWLLIIVGDTDAHNIGDYLPELIANGKTDEIEKWPEQTETNSPFEQTTSLFKSQQKTVS